MSEYDQIVSECAEQGKALMRMLSNAGRLQPLYLYGRRSEAGKGPGKLMLAREDAPIPEGVELVTGEGLRVNVPYDNYFQWVYDRAKRFPCLSWDDKGAA